MRPALLVALTLLVPLVAAQVPIPTLPSPQVPPQTPFGPAADEGAPGYVSFDCRAAPTDTCPARDAQRGEVLAAPAVAIDLTNPARTLVASLAGPSHDIVALRLSTDDGATSTRATLPETGATGVALAQDGTGTLVIASATGADIAVRRVPFERALEGGKPETIPAKSPARLSVVVANRTTFVGFAEGNDTKVAYARAGEAWRVASMPACAMPSNLVARGPEALVACQWPDELPEMELPARHVALLWVNVTAGNLTPRGHSAVLGEPFLALNATKNLTLAAFSQESPQLIHLRLAFSRNGTGWSLPLDVGGRIHRPNATPAISARLTAFAYQPTSDTLHLIWSEKLSQANATDKRLVKTLVVLSSRGVLTYKHDLDVDEPAARVQGNALLSPVDDERDAIGVFGAREMIAFGDDGALVHGELVEKPALGGRPETSVPPANPLSTLATDLSQKPPPKFTLGFSIAAGILITGIVARVLIGRIRASASAEIPKKEGP